MIKITTTQKAQAQQRKVAELEGKLNELQGKLARQQFELKLQGKDLWRYKKAYHNVRNILEPEQFRTIAKPLKALGFREND